jgi:hypothetical protein
MIEISKSDGIVESELKASSHPKLPGGAVIVLTVLVCGGLAYALNQVNHSWTVEDYVKLAGLWFTLAAAALGAWISYENATRQINLSKHLALEQQRFTKQLEATKGDLLKDIEVLKTSLARELEEAKVRIGQRYQAQVGLNEVAMLAADYISSLQVSRDTAGANELLKNIEEASARMQSKRGALLMVPTDYRDAWQALQQQVVFVAERFASELTNNPKMDVRAFYSEHAVGPMFVHTWATFYKVASFD